MDIQWYICHAKEEGQAHRDRQGRASRQGSSAADMQIDEPSEERGKGGGLCEV